MNQDYNNTTDHRAQVKDRIDQVRDRIIDMRDEGDLVLPDGYDVQNASAICKSRMITETVGPKNDKIPIIDAIEGTRGVSESLMNMMVMGLDPNPERDQCDFRVEYGTLKLQIGYVGMMALLMSTGLVEDIRGCVVYEGDTFSYHLEDGNPVLDEHLQEIENKDNPQRGAYAVIDWKDGRRSVDVMSAQQVNQRKQQSRRNKIWPEAFARKTVIKRLCHKYIRTLNILGNKVADVEGELPQQPPLDDVPEADIAPENDGEPIDVPEPPEAKELASGGKMEAEADNEQGNGDQSQPGQEGDRQTGGPDNRENGNGKPEEPGF